MKIVIDTTKIDWEEEVRWSGLLGVTTLPRYIIIEGAEEG